jgi:ABC-type nitrate/sulfonate/bicarbonate transport system substrate-binding protein
MRGLGKNSWQIVSTAFDNVLGWSGREGEEIIAVARISEGGTLPVYVRPEIKTWDDLRGKAMAVDAVDTAFALVLRRVLLAHGLEMARGDYSLIAKGTTGFRLDSMIKGETFAGVLNAPWDAKAAGGGHGTLRRPSRSAAGLSRRRVCRRSQVGRCESSFAA